MSDPTTNPDAYDLVVLGGGPAGVRAATEAGSRGLRVALVERAPFVHGAPTGAHSKCLREAALGGARSWDAVQRCLDRMVANSRANAARSLRTFRVEVIQGTGKATGPGLVEVTCAGEQKRALATRSIVIATGSSSNRFPPVAACFDAGLAGVYDSDTIWSLDYLPRRVAIQGGGIIGLEYAMIFAKLGAESITIFEVADDIVGSLDAALRAAIKDELSREGIALHCRTALTSVTPEPRGDIAPRRPLLRVGARGEGDAGERFLEGCDLLFAAPGRHGNTAGLGLEAGVHLFGEGSVEIVNYGADLLHRKQTVYNLLRCIFPAVTFHELYHLAATEAKLRLRGVRSLAAATAWKRMYAELEKAAEGDGCIVAAAFERFDRDNSGLLDKDELRQAMESLGVSLEEGEVEDMMREAMNGEADLDYRRFHRILVQGRRGSLCMGHMAKING